MALLIGGCKNSSKELLEVDRLEPDKYPGPFRIPEFQYPEQGPCQTLLLSAVWYPHDLGQGLGVGS